MKISAVRLSCIVISSILLFCASISLSWAGGHQVESLLRETQKYSDKKDKTTLVWWIPEEYWRARIAEYPEITEDQVKQIMKFFSPCLIAVVVDGKVNVSREVDYASEEVLISSLSIKDKEGKTYSPMSYDNIDLNVQVAMEDSRPILADMLGPKGENMHYVVFPARNAKGEKIADAKAEGSFSILLNEEEFKWKLPLGSMLPSKTCTTCGEKLSGAYKFCPWDATKL